MKRFVRPLFIVVIILGVLSIGFTFYETIIVRNYTMLDAAEESQ